jgi:hypothetical protein
VSGPPTERQPILASLPVFDLSWRRDDVTVYHATPGPGVEDRRARKQEEVD